MKSIANESVNEPNQSASRVRAGIGIAVAALFGCSVGWAQTQTAPSSTPSAGLEEIVVTAQKRSESLQTVPLSISALGSEELERRNIVNLNDLMGGQVPSLRIEPFAGNQTVLEVAIRGFVDPNGVNVTDENPVPVYIDDVFYGRQTAVALQLNEIERIEVLRGPQGTLFGKNAEGGAVRIITQEPTGTFGVRQTAEGGNYGYYNTSTHIDLPSVADVATKIDFVNSADNGWQTNPAPGQENFGQTKYTGARFTALWKPTDTVKAEYSFDWMQVKSTEVFNQLLATNDVFQYLAPSETQTIWPIQTARITSIAYPTYRPDDPQKFLGHRVTLNWDIGDGLALKSITAYRSDQSTLWNTASTSAVVPGLFVGAPQLGLLTGPAPIYDIQHSQVSEELQLTGNSDTLKWVTGFYWLGEHASQLEETYFGTAFPNAILSGPPYFLPVVAGNAVALDPPYSLGPGSQTGADVSQTSTAVFGQATWRPGGAEDKFSYTVGLRVGQDKKDDSRPVGGVYTQVTYGPPPTYTVPPPNYICSAAPRPAECTATNTHTLALPMATVAYDWTRDVSSYLRYSTGYQAAVIGLAGQLFQFIEPSKVDAFELGTKSEWFDHRVRVNGDVFYSTWIDPQENIQTVSSSTVEFFNGPNIYSYGVELDAAFLPIDSLTINLAANYLHGQQRPTTTPYPNPYAAGGSVPFEDKLQQMPKWTGSISALYDIVRTDYGVWRLDADANFTTSYYSVPNVAIAIGGYTLFNGRFSLAEIPVGPGKLNVSLWGKNLTNKNYETFVYAAPATGTLNSALPATTTAGSFGLPRTYGISVNFKY
ncbi:MAG: TonB-dependent receptor [Steroidobacteraceae bacterium]